MHAHAVAREPESARQPKRLTVWGGRALTALPIPRGYSSYWHSR